MTGHFTSQVFSLRATRPISTKLQPPSSGETSGSKPQSHQGRNAGLCAPACAAQPYGGGSSANGFRDLDFGISLELGAWDLELGSQARHPRASRNPKPWFLQE
jgi:hypothetical protein